VVTADFKWIKALLVTNNTQEFGRVHDLQMENGTHSI
jgi:hypothetical protein